MSKAQPARAALTTVDAVKRFIFDSLRDYRWNVRGLITDDNKVLPLPPEPALIAKVIEVSIIEHVKRKAVGLRGLDVFDDLSGRGYPDMLFTGRATEGKKIAVDVKVARRNVLKKGSPTRTQSRITLGPFDSYFRRPDDPIPGVGVAYGDLSWHVDLIALYDYVDGDVENVEILVVETWRVASRKRSSTTRNYIGAVDDLRDLRAERGAFDTIDEFYEYWRSQPIRTGAEPVPPPEAIELSDLAEGV
jgi:hypothetical protein